MSSRVQQFKQQNGIQPPTGGFSRVQQFKAQLQQKQTGQPVIPQQEEKPGFFSRVAGIYKKRLSNIKTSFMESIKGNQSFAEGAFQTAGQIAGGANDVIGEVGSDVYHAVLPKSAENFIVQKGNEIFQTPGGKKVAQAVQKGTELYDGFKEAHPRAARNLEAGVNIASLLPTGKATKVATEAVEEAAETGVKQVEKKIVSNAVKHLETKYEELFTGTKSAKKVFTKSTQQSKTPAKFLAEHGYIVDIQKGKVNAQPVITKIKESTKPLEDVLDSILKEKDARRFPSEKIKLSDLANRAKKHITTESNKASGTLQKQYQEIDNLIADLQHTYGDSVGLSDLNSIKRGQYTQSSAFDLNRPHYMADIHSALGVEAKQIIEDAIPEADIKNLNAYLGDHYDAMKNLFKIDGNAVKGGRLGNYFGRTTGAIIGAKAGPLGSMAGAYIGDSVTSIMQNNHIAGPIKRRLLERITKESPEFAKAQEALKTLKAQPIFEAGVTHSQKIVPQKLDYFKPNKNKPIRVNNFNNPSFPKYITSDQVKRESRILRYLENKDRPIDMKMPRTNIRYIPIEDTKPSMMRTLKKKR